MISDRPSRTSLVAWDRSVEEDGSVLFRTGLYKGWRVAEWPGLARLTCDARGQKARLEAWPRANPASVAKLRGAAHVLIGDLRGGVALHASAVAIGRRAVVLLGPSGAGKSTTAARLCIAHGGRLLADDAALLLSSRAGFRVMPSESRHYLDPAARAALGVRVRSRVTGKAAIVPVRRAARGVRLGLVASLVFDDSITGPTVVPLRGAHAAMTFLGAMFRMDVADRRRDLDQVLEIHSTVPVIEIRRSRCRPDSASLVFEALRDAQAR